MVMLQQAHQNMRNIFGEVQNLMHGYEEVRQNLNAYKNSLQQGQEQPGHVVITHHSGQMAKVFTKHLKCPH